MKTYQSAQSPGFFDVELRVQWLEARGDPLSRLDTVIDWEGFRPLLVQALAKPANGPGGRPANDPVKMFKLLVGQRYYNLSDEQTEYQVSDRLSFQKFAGWTVADKIPDANTLWDFREALTSAGVFEKLFEQLARHRHLRHLEDNLPGMAHDLRPDLDQFLPQRRQCPVTHCLGQYRLPQEVAQVVGQHEQLQPHLVVHKVVTGQPRPFDGVLAFLDPLLRRAPLVVEPHHPFGGPA